MIFRVDEEKKTLMRDISLWNLKEQHLEEYLLPDASSEIPLLNREIFGEELLFVAKQPITPYKKRPDIVAIDSSGSVVIIELKRNVAAFGVNMQALQYVVEYAHLTGQRFVNYFLKYSSPLLKEHIENFLDTDIETINQKTRIILIAQSFNEALFSMGEWLSSKDIAFRCIEYLPLQICGKRFLNFSIAFDRSPKSIYSLRSKPTREQPGYFWHNIGAAEDAWWQHLKDVGHLPTSFSNRPGDNGEHILRNYIIGDKIIAYANGYGAIGWGEIEKINYELLPLGDDKDIQNGFYRHRLKISWRSIASSLEHGISPRELREKFSLHHPRATSNEIKDEKHTQKLIAALEEKFSKNPSE